MRRACRSTARRCRSTTSMVNLSPGMAVTVEIKTGSRRIIGYLLSPLLKFKQEACASDEHPAPARNDRAAIAARRRAALARHSVHRLDRNLRTLACQPGLVHRRLGGFDVARKQFCNPTLQVPGRCVFLAAPRVRPSRTREVPANHLALKNKSPVRDMQYW